MTLFVKHFVEQLGVTLIVKQVFDKLFDILYRKSVTPEFGKIGSDAKPDVTLYSNHFQLYKEKNDLFLNIY